MYEQIIYNGIDPCPYLDGEKSRTPLRYQFKLLNPVETDRSFEQGDRRVGRMLYRTDCPSCVACEPIRIPVQDFSPSKSQRRILRSNSELRIEQSRASFSFEKLDLYNKHKKLRGLSKKESNMDQQGYQRWFLESCLNTQELRYYYQDQLIGVSILDIGEQDISSVYFFFDPEYSERSLGTFSALYEIQQMKAQKMRYYYLGLFVENCSHLSYKSRYYPHHRRVEGDWLLFADKTVLRSNASTVVT